MEDDNGREQSGAGQGAGAEKDSPWRDTAATEKLGGEDAAATASDQRCPVEMHDGKPCGRAIYHAPAGVDEEPVCLMHSKDPNKNDAAFQAEFERVLEEAGEGIADFTRFVFPSANYEGREFKAKCVFKWASFTQAADFLRARFTQGADFYHAAFTQAADFRGAKFTEVASFYRATFTQAADFSSATFTQAADFFRATFTQAANFVGATFAQAAEFYHATFTQEADFSYATLTQAADFRRATFKQAADFRGATFKAEAEFRETKFREDKRPLPGPIFCRARFERPEGVTFYQTYLGQALFHNCDVSRFVFSDVRWRRRANGKRMVFEEVVDLKDDASSALGPRKGSPDERNYRLIAETYQQLKKNYDDRRDYWTAGDFHYGEMEMKRLSSPRRNRVLRWLHRNLGLVAWYKLASEYGESYVLPALWLLVLLLVLTLVYPLVGLEAAASKGRPVASTATEVKAKVALVEAYSGHSFVTALGVAFFQRELTCQPSYPWGRVLAWVQLLLTYTLVALFLLAVRRQVRR